MSFATHTSRNEKIQEAYAILTQGIEVFHFSPSGLTKKLFWIDPDNLRLCVEKNRLSLAEATLGKVAYGIYIKDLAEINYGFPFNNLKYPSDTVSVHCLTLVAAETTITLQFPSLFVRNWFYDRFQYIKEDIFSSDMLAKRLSCKVYPSLKFSVQELDTIQSFTTLLTTGVQTVHHHPGGKIIPSILFFDDSSKSFKLQPIERNWIFSFATKPTILKVTDIVELRLDGHTLGIVRTNSLDLAPKLLSMVGTSGVLDIQFVSNETRDAFAGQCKLFIQSHLFSSLPNEQNMDGGIEGGGGVVEDVEVDGHGDGDAYLEG